MIKEEKYQKIENFFKKDLEIKQILNTIIPTEADFYDEELKNNKEKIFVRYFIPKNNNTNMTANLKGINVNKPEFAVGDFLTNKENFSNDIITLMKGIATDLDMEINNNY